MKALTNSESLNGWWLNCEDGLENVEAGVEPIQRNAVGACPHESDNCTFLKTLTSEFIDCPKLTKSFVPNRFLGKRLQMTAWVRCKLVNGEALMWLRIDGDWIKDQPGLGQFDNMDDRPLSGETEWMECILTVDVPETSTKVVYGLAVTGLGQVWVDAVNFQDVRHDSPLTGQYCT